MTYSEKLKDPRWQKKRLQVFERDGWCCQSCNRSDLSLQVHHLKYLPSLEPWDYELNYLVTYCECCHSTEHLIGEQIHESLLEIIQSNTLYVKPLAQLCILTEKYPGFYEELKAFLNESMISYLELKQAA